MPESLTTLRDRVEQILEDATNAKWDTTELDEAIRQALDAYSEHVPHRAVASITLTAPGREVDISALDYRTIERIWWDYDNTDPDHPPHWRDFELWPGGILYIDDYEEPNTGDVVRIWHTTDHTLNGLDSATATTFPDRHASVIARGAAAFAATQRRLTILEQANLNEWAPRNLREWAERQLSIFYQELQDLAQKAAALSAGTAPMPDLDRWDGPNAW
ncbi:MAG: hypothetical protein ACP5KN_21480 [Armatimonadota bacterium]